MTLCDYGNFLVDNCGDLQDELARFARVLATADQIKVGSGDHEPTWPELSGLWGDCLAPSASMVFWHNTDTDTVSWWFNAEGDYYELV